MFVNTDDELEGTAEDKALEKTAFADCIRTFLNYAQKALATNAKRRADYATLTAQHKRLLKHLPQKIAETDKRIRSNAAFLELLVEGEVTPDILVSTGNCGRQTRSPPAD
ncbi:hypothetical protein HDV00_010258 [Rhizophlyctis rosea]|nr:hypothetical protein HDV00_010258 [Rhizophlyctis rosea]